MITLNLHPILRMKGITQPIRYLIRKGHSPSYASNVVNNRAVSIPFWKLEQLCLDFNCTPNDLLDFVKEKDQNLIEGHALYSISKSEAIGEIHRLLHDLPASKIQELYLMMKEKE